MDFSTDCIYQLMKRSESVLESVVSLSGCESISSLRKENLVLVDKEDLSGTILSLVSVLRDCGSVFRSSSVTIESLKNDKLSNQSEIMTLQKELLTMKNEKLKVVSNQLNFNLKEKPAATSEPGNDERQKNIILFGMTENEEQSLSGRIEDVLDSTCGLKKPHVKAFSRLGKEEPGKVRPVKVCFDSPEDALLAVTNARNLKFSEKHRKIFIAFDRDSEERARRRELVKSLRKRREEEPGRFHFIYKGEICSREHRPRTPQHRIEKEDTDSPFALSDFLHSTLRKHGGLLQEKIDQLGASTEQAINITKSMIR